jgi:hypothetical protein
LDILAMLGHESVDRGLEIGDALIGATGEEAMDGGTHKSLPVPRLGRRWVDGESGPTGMMAITTPPDAPEWSRFPMTSSHPIPVPCQRFSWLHAASQFAPLAIDAYGD